MTDIERRGGRWLTGMLILTLAACASNPPAPVEDLSSGSPSPLVNAQPQVPRHAQDSGSYRVGSGDTLYAIAFKRGLDYRDLAAWNGIAAPYRIYVGQELRLSATNATSAPTHATPHIAPEPTKTMASAPTIASATPKITPARPAATAPPANMFEDVPPEPEKPTQVPAEPGVALPSAPAAAVQEIPKPVAATPAKPAEPESRQASTRPSDTGNVVWHWPSNGKVISNFAAGDMLKTGIDIGGNAGDSVLAAADGEVVYSGNGLIGYGELVIVKHNDSFLSAYGHNRKRLVQEHERVRAGQPIAEMGSSSASRDELHFEIRKNGKPVNPMDYLPGR